MAKDQNRRVKTKDLGNDIDSKDSLKKISGYKPHKSECEVANIQLLYDNMVEAQAVETQSDAALRTARDIAVAAEWSFHNIMLAAKEQVTSQFGSDSNELQSLGLKKTSEYKRPVRKKVATK